MQPLKPLYKKLDKCVRLLEELNAQVRDLRRKTSAIAEERSFNTGQNEPDSVKENYVKPGETKCDALAAMLDLGKGSGPMNHAFAVEGTY